MLLQVGIAARELVLAEPAAAVGGERRGVDGLQQQVVLLIYHVRLPARVAAPQHVDQVLAAGGQCAYGGVGELLPAQRGVAVGLVGTDGQRGVEQQHALTGPPSQVARWRHGCARVVLYLLEDVLQRGRKGHAVLHREGESVGLSWLVVGVLTYDDHLHLVEGAQVEGIEDEASRRVACRGGILVAHGVGELLEVGLRELPLQLHLPRGFYLYV